MYQPSRATDAFQLLAGDFATDLSTLLNGDTDRFVFAPRGRRHLMLCLLDVAPSAMRSAMVRFGPDAGGDELMGWVLDRPASFLGPVLKRLPAVALRKAGQYADLYAKLANRSRTGRALCHLGQLTQNTVDVVLNLPDALIEPKLVTIIGDPSRAKAVSQLFGMAVEDGYDVSNLTAALKAADDMPGIEGVLERAVLPDDLPLSPYPEHPDLRPITSAADLRKVGANFRNCLRHPFQSRMTPKGENSYFCWSGTEDAVVSVQKDVRGWRLAEVKLVGNRRPSDVTMAEIVAMFRQVGVHHRSDPADLLLAL